MARLTLLRRASSSSDQPRPVRSVHRSEGWTPESIAEHAMPSLAKAFYPLDRSQDVFSWDPV